MYLIRRPFRLDWLSQIAAAPSIDSEHFTWRLKLAIGFLHVSDEPFLGHLRVKSLAILQLFRILEQKDLSSKQQELTDFIEKYKTVMAAAAGTSDSEKNSNLTAKATSTDTDFNSSSENAMLLQDATSSKSLGLFSNEPQQPKPGTASSLVACHSPPPTEIVVPEESHCRTGVLSQVCPLLSYWRIHLISFLLCSRVSLWSCARLFFSTLPWRFRRRLRHFHRLLEKPKPLDTTIPTMSCQLVRIQL